METKTNKAIELYRTGNIKGAFSIIATFKLGFTKDERDTIRMAHECMSGLENFYKSIGINAEIVKQRAISIIEEKYGKYLL